MFFFKNGSSRSFLLHEHAHNVISEWNLYFHPALLIEIGRLGYVECCCTPVFCSHALCMQEVKTTPLDALAPSVGWDTRLSGLSGGIGRVLYSPSGIEGPYDRSAFRTLLGHEPRTPIMPTGCHPIHCTLSLRDRTSAGRVATRSRHPTHTRPPADSETENENTS